jgi:hypothetical protein
VLRSTCAFAVSLLTRRAIETVQERQSPDTRPPLDTLNEDQRIERMEPSGDVQTYIAGLLSPTRRRDARTMVDLMARVTGERATMWGSSIVGFGRYHYRYASGREGDAPAAGFSPRKAALSVYPPDGVGPYAELLSQLGDHSIGVGCRYIKDLGRVDLGVLEKMVAESYATLSAGTYRHRAAESQDGRQDDEA